MTAHGKELTDFDSHVTQLDYGVWKLHFGQTAGSGAGTLLAGGLGVPEPSLVSLAAASIGLLAGFRRRRPQFSSSCFRPKQIPRQT